MTAISEFLQKKLKSICPRSQISPSPKEYMTKVKIPSYFCKFWNRHVSDLTVYLSKFWNRQSLKWSCPQNPTRLCPSLSQYQWIMNVDDTALVILLHCPFMKLVYNTMICFSWSSLYTYLWTIVYTYIVCSLALILPYGRAHVETKKEKNH